MATSVNIAGGDDQFNRYKMPSVVGKVEGRGNGIKTRIVNCYEVARALHRPPGYVCKFFGCELGAQTKINDEAGIYIVNGNFNQAVLSATLQEFIKLFVLCGNCKLPETDLKLKKNGDIKQACNACGAETMCDMTHKLCTYIINNPPDGKKKKSDGKGKGDKADRRARKAAKEKAANGGGSAGAGLGDDAVDARKHDKGAARKTAKTTVVAGPADVELMPLGNDLDFAAEADAAADAVAAGNGASAFSMMVSGGPDDYADDDDDGVEWSVDTSKEAQEARMRDLGVDISILERGAKEEEEKESLKLRDYIDQGKKPSRVIAKAEKLFGEDRAIHGILAACVLGETKASIVKSIEKNGIPVLKQFGTPMDADSQMEFCNFLDSYGSDKNILAVAAHIIKTAFDEDILEEEHIFKWYRKQDGRKDVREAVKVIIEWLENAEEESDDEEESD